MRSIKHLMIAAATIATASIVITEMASASLLVVEGNVADTGTVYAVSYTPVSSAIFADLLLSSSYSLPTGYTGSIPSDSEQECEYHDRRDRSDVRISTSRDIWDSDCESPKKGRDSEDGHEEDGHDGGSHNGHETAPVPEPSTLILVGSGVAGYMLIRKARR